MCCWTSVSIGRARESSTRSVLALGAVFYFAIVRLGCGHHAANGTGVRPQAISDGRPASHVVPAEAEHRSTSCASTRRIGRNASDAGLLAPTTVTGPPSKIVAQGVFGVPCLGSFVRPRRGRVAKHGREPVLGPRAARLRCRLNDGDRARLPSHAVNCEEVHKLGSENVIKSARSWSRPLDGDWAMLGKDAEGQQRPVVGQSNL